MNRELGLANSEEDDSDDSVPGLVSDESTCSEDEGPAISTRIPATSVVYAPPDSDDDFDESTIKEFNSGFKKGFLNAGVPIQTSATVKSGDTSEPEGYYFSDSSEDADLYARKQAISGFKKGFLSETVPKKTKKAKATTKKGKAATVAAAKKAKEEAARQAKEEADRKERERIEEERRQAEAACKLREQVEPKAAAVVQAWARRFLARCRYAGALSTAYQCRQEFAETWRPVLGLLAKRPLLPSDRFQWVREKEALEYVLASQRDEEQERREEEMAHERSLYRSTVEKGKRNQLPSAVDEEPAVHVADICLAAGEEEPDDDTELTPAVAELHQVDFSKRVYDWFEKADNRLKQMFIMRLEKILSGVRTYSVAKPLKGCDHPVFEAKLDPGVRILWTELRRKGDDPLIFVWFVSKHDNVTRDLEYMNDYFRRQKKSMQKLSIENSEDNRALVMDDPDCWLLDPNGNSPLKIYTIRRADLETMMTSKAKLPLRLSNYEKTVNATKGAVLLVGRSGTGKTICLSQRMTDDRNKNALSRGRITQLFVSRSKKLRDHVANYHRDYCRKEEREVESDDNRSDFFDLEMFLKRMNNVISERYGASMTSYGDRRKLVTYDKFRDLFYSNLDKKKHPMHPAIVWTQIRSCIKGSVEAYLIARQVYTESAAKKPTRHSLPLEMYLPFSAKRSRISDSDRREVYAVFELYSAWLDKEGMWDDDDRAMDLLLRSNLDRTLCYARRHEGPYDKVYVDEVQDSTEVEVMLFCLAGGMNYDRIYLAGDPAQAIVEGVDFRFEEIRSMVHKLTDGKTRVERTLNLVNNFRSHEGILKCASSILDMMLELFPGSADIHEKDKGLCKGPRPGYIKDFEANNPLLTQLTASNPNFYLICRDQDAVETFTGTEQTPSIEPKSFSKPNSESTLISIRNSKGIEYDDVIIVNFFCTITSSEQQWWSRHFARLIGGRDLLPEQEYPQIESQLKLLYTAITRCCNRLVFVETSDSIAGSNFFRWLKHKDLAVEYTADMVREQYAEAKFYTHDEWKALGIKRAAEAYGAEGAGSMSLLRTSIECFERAGADAVELLKKAKLNEKYEREKMSFLSSSDTTHVVKLVQSRWASLIAECIESKFYREACEFCDLIRSRALDPLESELDVNSPSRANVLFGEKVLSVLDPLYEKI